MKKYLGMPLVAICFPLIQILSGPFIFFATWAILINGLRFLFFFILAERNTTTELLLTSCILSYVCQVEGIIKMRLA